jgi:hypothetical protein
LLDDPCDFQLTEHTGQGRDNWTFEALLAGAGMNCPSAMHY